MSEMIDRLHAIRPLTADLRRALTERIQTSEIVVKRRLSPPRDANAISMVRTGLLRVYYPGTDQERTIGFFTEGSCFLQTKPEMDPADRLTLQALETTITESLQGPDILHLNNYCGFGEYVQAMISRYFQSLQGRTQVLNLSPASERYRFLLEQRSEWIQRIPAKYIASYIGVSRETLSRIKSKMIW